MYCYKFPSKATFRTLAAAERLISEDDTLITASHAHAIDEVGIITVGGSYNSETGEVLEPSTVLAGWHVNTIGLAPEAWDQYLTIVNSASRVFSGCSTQAPSTDILKEIAS